MNSAAKAAHDAYECTETLVEDHPLLSATIGIGVAIAAKMAFKGKLAILWPDAKAILEWR
jgi:hypothetical protein